MWSPAPIMFRSRRGTSVYLVYDEDTFLASHSGALTAAPSASAGNHRSPHLHHWTRALVLVVTAAMAAHLVVSRVSHGHGSASRLVGERPQTAASRPGTEQAGTRG